MSHLPIRVNTLRGDLKIDFDVYLKINDKMILYLRQGDSFEGPRLVRLKSKKLKKMFILPEHEAAYREYVQRNIDMAYDDRSGKDLGTRTEIIHGQQQSQAEEVMEKPEDAEVYQIAKEGSGKYAQFLLNNDQAIAHILNLENTDQSLSHHGVSVAALSVGLAKQRGQEDAKLLHLMTLGALLHDLGHQDHPGLSQKTLSSMSAEEKKLYQSHPDLGVRKVQDKKHFDQLVVNIIAQHEECADGSGYPHALKEQAMDPTVLMVATCNAYDRYVSFEGLSRVDAGKRLMMDSVGRYPLDYLKYLVEFSRES